MPCVPLFCIRSGLGPAFGLSGGLPLTLGLSPEGRGTGFEVALDLVNDPEACVGAWWIASKLAPTKS